MKNAPKIDAPESGQETTVESDEENTLENPPENEPDFSAENLSGQMSLENLSEDVAKTYDGFDPSKHATNEDGTPRMRVDGSYALKRGRKAGTSIAQASQIVAEKPAPMSAKAARAANVVTNKAAAHATVKTVVTMLGGMVGEEWNFADQDEADAMVQAVTAYYDANGQIQMSPETMLGIQLIAYAAPRVQHPNTKSKLEKAWDWTKKIMGYGGA